MNVSGKLQEFSPILGAGTPLLRGFDAKNLPPGPAVERFFPSKVPLFSDKSHTGERQKCHSQDASVALLTCKSATLAIQNFII